MKQIFIYLLLLEVILFIPNIFLLMGIFFISLLILRVYGLSFIDFMKKYKSAAFFAILIASLILINPYHYEEPSFFDIKFYTPILIENTFTALIFFFRISDFFVITYLYSYLRSKDKEIALLGLFSTNQRMIFLYLLIFPLINYITQKRDIYWQLYKVHRNQKSFMNPILIRLLVFKLLLISSVDTAEELGGVLISRGVNINRKFTRLGESSDPYPVVMVLCCVFLVTLPLFLIIMRIFNYSI